MKRWSMVALIALAMLGSHSGIEADGRNDRDDRDRSLSARLSGFEEPPSVNSPGRGTFRARISRDETSIHYELRFSDLAGLVTQSHIHIAQRGVNGGIALWLCQTARNPAPESVAAATPFCNANPDANEGMVTGVLTAAQVIGPAGGANPQSFAAGNLEDVIRAIRGGYAYVNVHSTRNGPGEIRGQIRVND